MIIFTSIRKFKFLKKKSFVNNIKKKLKNYYSFVTFNNFIIIIFYIILFLIYFDRRETIVKQRIRTTME